MINRKENPQWSALMDRLTDVMCLYQHEFNLLVAASTRKVPGCGELMTRSYGHGPVAAWLTLMPEENLKLVGAVLAANDDQTSVAIEYIKAAGFAALFGLQ
jgi:hypothetical protein